MRYAKGCPAVLLAVMVGLAAAPAQGGFLGVGWDGPGQGAASLGFNIGQHPGLESERPTIVSALENWVDGAMVDITFTEVAEPGLPRSLDFRFSLEGDPAGHLGFAAFPDDVALEPVAGDIHLDRAENWTSHRTGPGTCTFARCDLYYVALHEIGHALGLSHPNNVRNTPPGRVMNPFFNPVFGSVRGFGAFDSVQPPDIADLCSAYSCTGAGSVRTLGAAAVAEPAAGALLLAGLLLITLGGRYRHQAG